MSRKSRAIAAALLAIVLAAAASSAFAGITTTVKPGDYALRQVMPDKSLKEGGRYGTLDLCNAAIKAQGVPGDFRCDTSVQIKAVDDCIGVKAPTIPLVKNADGFVEEPDAFAVLVDGHWTTQQNLYVRAPAGAAACWVRGLADPDEWRVNGTNPDAVFMERIEPGMTPLADQPNFDSSEPTWNDTYQALWENPVSVAARALP